MKILVNEKLSEHRYKTPEGYLICTDAILARTGKQEYKRSEVFGDECKNPDDSIFVDRTVDEVFSDATLASFENKAVTVEHPDENIDAHNHNMYSVGFVRDVKRANVNGQDVMTGTLVITDAKAIEEIENGEHTDLSCGYDCDILDEENPRQRHIRGNHVALCAQGRAGIARIVDSTNNAEYERQTKQGFPIVAKYKDGGRLHVIAKRSYDYIVCLGYDERTGTWSQGRYDNSTLGRAIDTLITEKPNAIRISDSIDDATPEAFIERIRTSSIPLDGRVVIDAPSGWLAVIEHHGINQYEDITKRPHVSPKVLSAATGRLWYKKQFIRMFEGPLNVVKSDMIKYIRAFMTDSINDSNLNAERIRNLSKYINNLNSMTNSLEKSTRVYIDNELESIKRDLKLEFDKIKSNGLHSDKVNFQGSMRKVGSYVSELKRSAREKARMLQKSNPSLSTYLQQAIDNFTNWSNANFVIDSIQNAKTFKVECKIDDVTHVYNVRANSINDAIKQIKDLQNFAMTEQEAKLVIDIIKKHYQQVFKTDWPSNDIYLERWRDGYSVVSDKTDLTKFEKWLSNYVVTQHMIS